MHRDDGGAAEAYRLAEADPHQAERLIAGA